MLHYQGFPYLLKIIRTEIISIHPDDALAEHFGIEMTRELVARKYYWPTQPADIETYVKGCDVYVSSNTVKHKPYDDLQSLLVLTYC